MSEPHNNFSSLDYSQYEEDVEELEQETDKKFSFVVSIEEDGERIDKVLSSRYLGFSRSRLKTVIEEGDVLVDGESVSKPKQKLLLGQQVDVTVKSRPEDCPFTPTPMDLDIVYEDDSILVINKPAGLVVHPATGHWNDTLVNGLLAYNESFSKLPRAGVVHRLDRETSGLMVVAKTEQAQLSLVKQLQERTVKREYWALTRGPRSIKLLMLQSNETRETRLSLLSVSLHGPRTLLPEKNSFSSLKSTVSLTLGLPAACRPAERTKSEFIWNPSGSR